MLCEWFFHFSLLKRSNEFSFPSITWNLKSPGEKVNVCLFFFSSSITLYQLRYAQLEVEFCRSLQSARFGTWFKALLLFCLFLFCFFFVSLCWSPHSTVCTTISNTDGMNVSPDLPMALTVPGVATKRKEWVGKMVVWHITVIALETTILGKPAWEKRNLLDSVGSAKIIERTWKNAFDEKKYQIML